MSRALICLVAVVAVFALAECGIKRKVEKEAHKVVGTIKGASSALNDKVHQAAGAAESGAGKVAAAVKKGANTAAGAIHSGTDKIRQKVADKIRPGN